MGQATGSPLLDLKNTEIKPCQVATYGQYNYYKVLYYHFI